MFKNVLKLAINLQTSKVELTKNSLLAITIFPLLTSKNRLSYRG